MPQNRICRVALPIFMLVGFAAHAQPTQIVIDDTQVFPESLTSTADGSVIIGSSGHGTVYRVAPGAAKATSWIAAGPNKLGRVLGVFANETANTLWVCTNDPDPKGTSADLKAFDLKTAAAKGSYPFPNGGLCNDAEVTRDGTTYVTDTRGGRILALKPGATALTVWAADPKWVGIDGIALLPSGAILFNNVRENQLVRVDMKPAADRWPRRHAGDGGRTHHSRRKSRGQDRYRGGYRRHGEDPDNQRRLQIHPDRRDRRRQHGLGAGGEIRLPQ